MPTIKFSVKTMSQLIQQSNDCLVIIGAQNNYSAVMKKLDAAARNQVTACVQQGDLGGDAGANILLPTIAGNTTKRILLVETGASKMSSADFIKVLNAVGKRLSALKKVKKACLLLVKVNVIGHDFAWQCREIGKNLVCNSYRYTSTLSKPPATPAYRHITLACDGAGHETEGHKAVNEGAIIGGSINHARHLGNLPANHLTPSDLAKFAKKIAMEHAPLTCQVISEKDMRQLGMNSLLSVSAGSVEEAKLIIMRYQGAAKSKKPYVLVGKGITFDTGGISLKPSSAMDEMKFDMCGAATVIGAVLGAVQLKLPINVVSIIAAAENMPNGNATKPGDVVTSMSGKTIEILNTDAEGRLVLCDAITYAKKFNPLQIIDVATLTGACVVALGHIAAAVYTTDDKMAQELLAAGDTVGDRLWRMPLWEEYQKDLKSNFADVANIGGRSAGSVTAACFLARFADFAPWAHLDIAGVAWKSGGKDKAATGRPVGALLQYLQQQAIK